MTCRNRVMLLVVAWGLLWSRATLGQEEDEAEKVFEAIHASVVALQNAEGSGTGILLDDTGLILSNAHVVASPVAYECKVEIETAAGKVETLVFKPAKIVGFHMTQDLALVRIDPQQHPGKLKPARLAKNKGRIGQRVYAIGNPALGGQILGNTITLGIISGVDRPVDGVNYYQTSASINPGNSGGPLCDKNGEVVGLNTLKATEVENVGFALPLYDLDTTAFVPMSKRKGDPTKAKTLLDQAEKLTGAAQKATKRAGFEDEEAKFYKYMAVRCYHMALTYDPGNSVIYYNVGMLLRALEMHEAAAAYLLQAIQLNPWAEGNSEYYGELGLALLKQEKVADALAVWEEGTTKFPVAGAKIWEQMAIYYMDHDKPGDAAYSAAVVLHLKQPNTQVDLLSNLDRHARQKMSNADKQALDAKVSQIKSLLDERQITADKQRKLQQAYLTEPFEKYVEASGSLGKSVAENLVVKTDPQTTATPANGLLDRDGKGRTKGKGKPAAPGEKNGTLAGNNLNKPPALNLAIPAGSVDLLAQVNLKQGAVRGVWKRDGKSLVTPVIIAARLPIPAELPAEYDLVVIVERKSNQKELVIGFVRQGVQSAFLVDAADGNASGLDPDAKETYRERVLKVGSPVTLVLKVRREGLLVTADGAKIFSLRSESPLPAIGKEWKVTDESSLMLGSNVSKFVIHKLMLTPYVRKL